MTRALLALAVLTLTSCAATRESFTRYEPADYTRGEATAQQFDRESAGCQLEGEKARNTYGYGGLMGITSYNETYNRAFDACMRSKGYARKA